MQTVQKWNPNYSNSPVIGSAVNTALLTQSKTTDYVGNKIYENGSLKRILVDGGYIEGGTYYFYLTDHLGNNRIVANQSGTVVQKNHYYPFGTAFAEATDQGKQPYKYNGKELDNERGLNLYDYSARYYESATGRFTTVDPLAEKYYSISPYAYCANNPVNAIDRDGRLIIFINGMHFGDGGKSAYWNGFDKKVMNHLNDYNAIYRDGSAGGVLGIPAIRPFRTNLFATHRRSRGAAAGKRDAAMILDMITDKDGNITETVKIITHSMGGAYAKRYVESLLKFFEKNNIDKNVIEFEANFAPFQPTFQKAVENVATYQFSHSKDDIANNRKVKGAVFMDTSEDENQGHSISSFIGQIWKLPTGDYEIIDGRIIRK